jgi:hypothetical protein
MQQIMDHPERLNLDDQRTSGTSRLAWISAGLFAADQA